jgi:chloride channel 7
VTYYTTAACIAIGVAGGVFGALFNIVANRVAKLRATRKFYRFCEVMLLCVVSTTLPYWLSVAMPQASKCMSTNSIALHDVEEDSWNRNSQARVGCPANHTNFLNSIFFDSRDVGLAKLFTMKYDELPASSSALICAMFFIGMILTYGVALPTGLFMPSVLIGVTFGRVVAHIYIQMNGQDNTYLFAIAGAAAFLCGIQRNALSIVVIMMEATQTASFVLPIIVSSAVAKWIGDRCCHSLNHTSMHRRGVPFLEPTMCACSHFAVQRCS